MHGKGAVQVPAGRERRLNRVDVVERAGDDRIGIDEKEIPFHVEAHARFQQARAQHRGKRRVQRSHHHGSEEGFEGLPYRPAGIEALCGGLVGEENDFRSGIVTAGAGYGDEGLLQIAVLDGTYEDINEFRFHQRWILLFT